MTGEPARPLKGRRVVVTRPRAQSARFVVELERLGAEVVSAPMIRVTEAADPGPLRRAVRRVARYDWVVFTSANGVVRFWEELEAAGADDVAPGAARYACIGPGTAAALEARGIHPEVAPATYVAEALVDVLVEFGHGRGAGGHGVLAGSRILLPLAAGARSVLADGLAAHGADVERVEAYRSLPDHEGAATLRRRLATGAVDAVTFTASSTVDGFVAAVGVDTGRAVIAVIGPITAETARRHGLRVDVVAAEHTIAGLVRALREHFARKH